METPNENSGSHESREFPVALVSL